MRTGAARGQATRQPPASSDQGRPRVMVVDDVRANLVAVEALLDDMNCDVVLCASGEEALRQLLKGDYAMMLLDVQMPEMDGYEVAHHARSNPATREVPILFLTALHNNEDDVLRGYGTGAVDFLFKPINSAILRSKVNVFLELYTSRRQLADTNEQLRATLKELKATQSKLVQTAKMASLGELVAGVAHEINNPLAFVIGHLGTVRKGLSEVSAEVLETVSKTGLERWERSHLRLQEMAAGLERIRELVVKLRTFSRLDEGEQKTVSIKECIDSILMILRHRLKDRIRVEVRCGEPDQVECFPGLLNQAVMNLVSNSIDAIEGDGMVTIETGLEGDSYRIVVTDTGCGIPDSLHDRVLEPFFTTKPVGLGTGLGLSITYSIVKKHGGTLELCDAPERGTMAIIRLPVRSTKEGEHG